MQHIAQSEINRAVLGVDLQSYFLRLSPNSCNGEKRDRNRQPACPGMWKSTSGFFQQLPTLTIAEVKARNKIPAPSLPAAPVFLAQDAGSSSRPQAHKARKP